MAHLGGDNAVVGVTLRDVGLSSRRGLFMPYVDRPTVHPDLLPRTLTETETFKDINSNTGGERKKKVTVLSWVSIVAFSSRHYQ